MKTVNTVTISRLDRKSSQRINVTLTKNNIINLFTQMHSQQKLIKSYICHLTKNMLWKKKIAIMLNR